MRVGVGILTYNMFKTEREPFFRQAWEAFHRPGDAPEFLIVVTNCSTDGTDIEVKKLGGMVDNAVNQIWFGMELAIKTCLDQEIDIVVFQADDYVCNEGWLNKLKSFWLEAPESVKLATLHIEPLYDWNQVISAHTIGGQRCLYRRSVAGSSWSFRARDWEFIGPLPRMMPGEDLEVCKKLHSRGFFMAALDLAEHAGEKQSAWGNESWKGAGVLDKKIWGFPE